MNYDYCDGMIYTIKKGDTLYSISRSRQVPLSMLLRANPYVDVYNLQVGDTICIPMRRKPCGGRPKHKMQNTQDMAESNDVSENIKVTRAEGEVVNDNTSEPEVMEFNETEEAASTMDTVQNKMIDENNLNVKDSMVDRDGRDERHDRDGRYDRDERYRMMNRRGMEKMERSGGNYTKYVTQPGDTLADVMARSDAGQEVFWENNAMDRIHLLPGISYLVFEETE